MSPPRLELIALPGIPLVAPGDDVAGLILDALARAEATLADGDVLVVAQKIVSKAEDRYVDLDCVTPTARAEELAVATGKDPRLVELILAQSTEVLRHRPNVIVVAHKLGFVMANAGIDASNLPPENGGERVLLLPEDPDGSAGALRDRLGAATGADVAVVINDSVGRAWRIGIVGTALGAAGLTSMLDLNGRTDLYDRPLRATQVGLADEIASAASLLQGQADEGLPVVLLRGLDMLRDDGDVTTLLRPLDEDMFR